MSNLLKTSIAQAIRNNLKYKWLKVGQNTNEHISPPTDYACSAEIKDAVDAVIKIFMALDKKETTPEAKELLKKLEFSIEDWDDENLDLGDIYTILTDCKAFIEQSQHLQAEIKRKNEALKISKMTLKDIDNKLKADSYLIDDTDDRAVRTIIKQELKRIEQALAEQQLTNGK